MEPDPPASIPGKSESWREQAVVLIFYIALAFIFTLPNSIHPTQALLGRGGDNYLHAWFLWEFARAVVHGQNPFHTTLILYPIGANLAWATTDILGQIMAVPSSLLLGPILTYNLTLVLQLALGAFFARLLCQRVCGDAAAATIGGMIFGFSPFLLAHAWGHLSLVTTFPLPVYVLALGRLLDKEEPSWKDGALLGPARRPAPHLDAGAGALRRAPGRGRLHGRWTVLGRGQSQRQRHHPQGARATAAVSARPTAVPTAWRPALPAR